MPQNREPIFNIPAIVLATFATLAAIHGLREAIPDSLDFSVLRELAFIPVRLTLALDAGAVQTAFSAIGGENPHHEESLSALLDLLGDGSPKPWTLLSYALLHADWGHLIVNSLWLIAFGTPVARRFGPLRYLLLCLVTAMAGALTHLLVHPYGLQPVIGASAVVSGLMGAALRFAFQPRERHEARLPLASVFTERRTLSFLAVWLTVNFVAGVGAVPLGLSTNSIAWEAHIGGLAAGLLLFAWFDPVGDDPLAPPTEPAHSPHL